MQRTVLVALSIVALVGSTSAWAVGDVPVRMKPKQVASFYRSIRPLLVSDGVPCPLNQHPVSGIITGGASPQGGSQQTVLTFDKGAKVTVLRTWNRSATGTPATIEIVCSL